MTENEVLTAISAAAIVTAAGVPAYLNNRYLKQNVGKKNGKGTVIEMGEALLTAFEQHALLDEERFKAIAAQIDDLDGTKGSYNR